MSATPFAEWMAVTQDRAESALAESGNNLITIIEDLSFLKHVIPVTYS